VLIPPKQKVRITRHYTVQYSNPISVAAGERVKVGHEDQDFPGWMWCKAMDGRESWVPIELLSKGNEGDEAMILQDYSARELDVERGEEVIVEDSRHDWLLVRNARGECGWIPASDATAT